MNSVDQNPYAPPATESVREAPPPSMDTLARGGPVHFSGTVTRRDVRGYLREYSHVGCGFLLAMGAILAVLALGFGLRDGGIGAIALGVMGLFLTASVASTLPYRHLMFESANPDWQQHQVGTLQQDGIHLDRGGTRYVFHWNWYFTAVGGEDWVAFLPATQPMKPLFLTRSMVREREDWKRVVKVAAAVAEASEECPESMRLQQNLHWMRQSDRPRSSEVPPHAIAFAGPVRPSDLTTLPPAVRHLQKPARSHAVVMGLILSGSFIIAGLSDLLFDQFTFLPIFLVIYAGLAAAGIAVRGRRGRMTSDGVVSYLKAYASRSSVLLDYGVTVCEIDWSRLQVTSQDDSVIVLRRRDVGQFIVARRDMFASSVDWEAMKQLVRQSLEG